jgi:hypothetical protein
VKIFFSTIAVVAVTAGVFGVRALSTEDTTEPFSSDFLLMTHQSPDQLLQLITIALPACLDDDARRYITDSGVFELATKTLFKSGVLMAERKSADASSKEMVSYILEQSKSLNAAQKANYLSLMKSDLNGSDITMRLCLRENRHHRPDRYKSRWMGIT